MSKKVYIMTIKPGFPEWLEPVKQYVKRENFGPDMTIYTFDNKISALIVKKRLEDEGYIIHLDLPDEGTLSTDYCNVYTGIIIG